MADNKTATKDSTTKASSHDADSVMVKAWHVSNRYYLELARLTTGMFVGIIALMTFLLTVGLQHPQKPFQPVFYTTVSLLALGLILFVVGHMAHQMLMQRLAAETVSETKVKAAKRALKVIHILQQIVFVLGVLAVLALVLVSAHIFFAIPAQPAAPAAASGQ